MCEGEKQRVITVGNGGMNERTEGEMIWRDKEGRLSPNVILSAGGRLSD